MKISAPTNVVFFISLFLGVLGLLDGFGIMPIADLQAFHIMTAAWGVLTLGTVLKGI
ncbi:MAG: hypothetical protein AAF431_18745 [Pseudomonadota bacterium]